MTSSSTKYKFDIKYGNIWETSDKVICVLTCSSLKKDGTLVMGAGIALEAAKRYPILPTVWGKGKDLSSISLYTIGGLTLVRFPTKFNWMELSCFSLIQNSATDLANHEKLKDEQISLPCPGIGYGGRTKTEVLRILDPILDERFTLWFKL